MLYIIVIIIPDPYRKKISSLQEQYKDPNWKITLPPHITIMPPSSLVDGASVETLKNQINATIPSLSAFQISTGPIKKFDNKFGTIYLSVENSNEIVRLHQIIKNAVLHSVEKLDYYPDNFIPHITLSGDIPENALFDKYSEMKEINLAFDFNCSSIGLFCKNKSDNLWTQIGLYDFPDQTG
ncbi:MAG: 2'-5' RNA ligase family protein [Patescibacteria group bacterium]|jgi:2'-5' RNA ligase